MRNAVATDVAAPDPGMKTRADLATRVATGHRWGHRAVDPVVALVLVILSYLVRRGGLPTDGLWYDDAWVATGAAKGGFAHLLLVSTNHPGFSAMLMVWGRVSARSELMAWPELAAGVVAGPLVYLALRRWRVTCTVAVLVCATLVVSAGHVQYSTRVKSYVFETLIVLALAVLLPRLARTHWRWTTVVAWVVGTALVGTFSAFALAATALAMVILVLHARDDRAPRFMALGLQGVVQLLYLRAVQRTYNSAKLTEDWERVYDGYVELDSSPSGMVKQVASHVSRVGQALIGGRGVLPMLVVLVALVGLAIAARRGPQAVMARYLLALPMLAAVGSVAQIIPFGASNDLLFSPGWRASLWLLPSLLAGLAFALDAIVRRLTGALPRSAAPVQVGMVVLAAVVVVAGWTQMAGQPLSGSRSAHEYVETNLGSNGLLIMFGSGVFPHAAEPRVPIIAKAAPESLNGFVPVFKDPRIWLLSQQRWDRSLDQLRRRIGSRDRVIVHDSILGFGDSELPSLIAGLRKLGFVQKENLIAGGSVALSRWERAS